MIAVVTGVIATYPVGGVTWDYAQYAVGLERLGFDVYYLEDSGLYTYDADANTYSADCSYGVRYLSDTLAALSPTLGRRWHFRHFDGSCYGLPRRELLDVVAEADLFLNVSGLCQLRDEYIPARRKVYIDTDPGWNHFHWFPRWDSEPPPSGTRSYRSHDVFFTYALALGTSACRLPDQGLDWHPTRPPVVRDRWTPNGDGDRWTTVLTWDNYRQPVEWQCETYGSKEPEFSRIEALPSRTRAALEVAVGGEGAPTERWKKLGWRVVDSLSVSRTPDAYRAYIEGSRGEFSVAKNVYVATCSGWFSCRTTCYLAAGKPAVVQDTGFSRHLPTGDGIIAFTTVQEAAAAIARVEADLDHHRRAAREMAEAWFDADTILADIVETAGVG